MSHPANQEWHPQPDLALEIVYSNNILTVLNKKCITTSSLWMELGKCDPHDASANHTTQGGRSEQVKPLLHGALVILLLII